MSNLREALYAPRKYQGFYKQWKENELPYKVLLSWLEPELQTLKNRLAELDSIPDKGPYSYSQLELVREKEAIEYAINYLQGIFDEVKESVPAPVSFLPQAPETPEQVLKYEEQALALLLMMNKINYKPETKKIIKDKEIILQAEYRINTSIKDVRTALIDLKEKGEIHIIGIDLFMKNRLKGKKGGNIANSFRTAKSVKKRKIS